MKSIVRFFLILFLMPGAVLACDDGFYLNEDNVCTQCPIGYSGSGGVRDSIDDCFVNCVNQTLESGVATAKTGRVYWHNDAYPVCEYNINCNPGYYYTGDINYSISDKKLVWVNPKIYLRGFGGQYIDTGINGNNDNLRFEVKYEWVNMPSSANYFGVFGNYSGRESANVTRLIQYGSTRTHVNLNTAAEESDNISQTKNPGEVFIDYLDNTTYKSGDKEIKLDASKEAENNNNILLFAEIADRPADIKIYYFKVWDGDTLIRYMVPVNKGMVIGATTIQDAGMWDLVNERFYGNQGKDSFYYGGAVSAVCDVCVGAVYSHGGDVTECTPCPDGYSLDEEQGKTAQEQCTIFCMAGTYVANSGGQCSDVGVGYWAPSSVVYYGDIGEKNLCPDGLTTAGYGAAANEEADCGKALRIGNSRIVFGKQKKTEHALAALIDGQVYYGAMSPNVNTINTIKVHNDGKIYSLHDDNSVENIGIVAGKLLWVDENTYLASDGYQYINTGVPGNNANLSFKIKYAWTVLPKGYEAIFANYESETANITRLLQSGSGTTYLYVDTRTNAPMARYNKARQVNTPYIETLDFKNYSIDGNVIPLKSPTKGTENNKSILLLKGATSEHPKLKIYYFKVYDKGKLVRNFVPIYKGAKIGDFVVPGNGMWDIVEQKFYPNAGTGSFTYGYGG